MPLPYAIACARRAAGTDGTWARASYTAPILSIYMRVSYIAPQVLNLALMGEATEHDSGPNGTSNGAAFSLGGVGLAPTGRQGDFDGLDMVPVKAKRGEEASLNGGPTPIARARRPSYSRLSAPPAVRPSSRPRPRSRRLTHDLAHGRARVEATVSSSSVPSQRRNTLP